MPEWGPLMETGIPVVDAQHKQLVRRLNELGLEMKKGRGRESVADLLAFLRRYAKVHFDTEERLMRECDYPGIEEHLARHAEFRKDFEHHLEAFAGNPAERSATLDIHEWMMSWLQQHVMSTDLKLADYMRDKGLI